MSTIMENCLDNEYGYDKKLYTKGAAEIIIKSCTHYIDENGNKTILSNEMQSILSKIISDYSSMALRTIGIAYKDL
jgi:magnesium-transporting ATPase (P-type)